MAEKNQNRSQNVRRGDYYSGEYSRHRDNGSARDRRHDFDAGEIPSWDTSERANTMRSFARWKRDNPMKYENINNMIIGAPFVLIRLAFTLLALPFRSKDEKRKARYARELKKESRVERRRAANRKKRDRKTRSRG